MDLTCYLDPSWRPFIRPAETSREWIDDLPESFGYRCLPLAVANTHGWEILNPVGFSACWTGGDEPDAVLIRVDAGSGGSEPVALFGGAVLTFHIEGLFRTPPHWDLWVSGSPNRLKDGIGALTGIIETDWSPYTFTMNWRFTRPLHWIRFERLEPIAFIFPIQRGILEKFEPRFAPLSDNPALQEQFEKWTVSRNYFQDAVKQSPSLSASDRWQKRYYRGLDMDDRCPAKDHRIKLKLKEFASPPVRIPDPPAKAVDIPQLAEAIASLARGVHSGSSDGELIEHLSRLGFSHEISLAIVQAAREKLAASAAPSAS